MSDVLANSAAWLRARGVEQWPGRSDAGYLHRLAVRRHGEGSESLLHWAEGHVAAEGKAYLRLDCAAWNESLRAYYERAGYEHVGDVTV